MKQKEVRSLVAEMRITKNDDGTRTVTGLIPYNSLSCDLGGYKEMIAPGAFADAFNADVLALRDHDPKLLLGRTKSGTLTLTDSDEGLRYKVDLPNTTAGNDLAESASRGDLDSTSFGFYAIETDWAYTDDDVVRTLKQVELIEVSPCSFAAYPDSSISLRSAPPEIRSRIEGKSAPALDPVPYPQDTEQQRNYMHMHMRLTLLSLQ